MVSGLVVNTSIELSCPIILKFMDTPIDFPIQFLCVSFIELDQSILSKSFNSLSA